MTEERAWETQSRKVNQPTDDEKPRMEDEWRQRRKEREEQRVIKERLRLQFLCLCVLTVAVGTAVLAAGRLKGGGQGLDIGIKGEGTVQAGIHIEDESVRQTGEVCRPEETKGIPFEELPRIGALYGIHVQGKGWSNYFPDNSYGMAPVGGYITALRVTLHNQPKDMTGTIEYQVNLSGSGWLAWQSNAQEAGGALGEMPLEAVSMRLTGDLEKYYDVMYSVLQNNTWTEWVMNGQEAGVAGAGLRVDGLRVSVVRRQEGKASYAGEIDPSKPMVALTYDDGPSRDSTPRILEKLKECGGRATFFMVGNRAERFKGTIAQMVQQGCEVANHTYDHTLMTKVAPKELERQLEMTNQVVAQSGGVTPVLMRPCGGATNDAGMGVAGAISMPAILWSIDTLDWKTRNAEATVSAVLDHVKDGDIILMHDLYEATADASDILIPELIKRGYQLVTVSELASYRGGMTPGQSYHKFRP